MEIFFERLPYALLTIWFVFSVYYLIKARRSPNKINPYIFESIPQVFPTIGILGGIDESTIPCRKSYLKDIDSEPYPSVFYRDGRAGTITVEKLIGKGLFNFPKDVDVVSNFIRLCSKSEDLILDFFAGSGTTAQATMQLNLEDGGKRKFICVQLPEPIDVDSTAHKAGFKNIAEITKERIRKAGEKIKSELNEDLFDKNGKDLDVGFKVFKLDSSNIIAWDGNPDKLEMNLLNSESNIKENRTEEDVLYEILLKYGLDLALPIEHREIAGKTVFNIGLGALFICLANGATTEVAEGIGMWKKELAPATAKVIFKDNGFTDVEKTNSIQILKRYGIEEVNSI